MKTIPLPPLELLQDYFEVDDTSPSGLRWKNPKSPRCKKGQIAGYKNKSGYWMVTLCLERKTIYLAHRIVYFLIYKEDPQDFQVDHITGDLNNNICLRKATKTQNQQNRKPNKNSSSHLKGVWFDRNTKRWRAGITVNGKHLYLGRFESESDAARAYNISALENFGEFARINNIDG